MKPRSADDERIEAVAAEWLVRREGGWTAAEAEEFRRWRAAQPKHDAAFQRLERAQHLLARLPQSDQLSEMLAELDALPGANRRPIPFRRYAPLTGWLAAAAALVLIFWWAQPQPGATSAYTAGAEARRSVDLADGSTLLLNTGSDLEVSYAARERRITLHHGEVQFSVASDRERPFIVSAGKVRITAIGTAFNVRRAADAIHVVVTEGKVRVARDGTGRVPPVELVAGQATSVEFASGALPRAVALEPVELRARVAWQAPRLEFRDTPLRDVVARFNQYSPVQLALGDPDLGDRPIVGSFAGDNAEAFAHLLLASGDIRLERGSEHLLVLHPVR